MPQFIRIAGKSELPTEDEAKEFTVGDKVVCVANVGGQYHAMDNVCVHRGGPLGQGVVMGDKVVCPWHGWVYDPKTGVPDVNPRVKVDVYRIKIEGDDVLVEM